MKPSIDASRLLRTGSAKRGAVLVEAIIVIPVLILLWGGLNYLYRASQSKVVALREARTDAWRTTMNNCKRSRRSSLNSSQNDASCANCASPPPVPQSMAHDYGSSTNFTSNSYSGRGRGPIAQGDTAFKDLSVQPTWSFQLPCNLVPGQPDRAAIGMSVNQDSMVQFSGMFEQMFAEAMRKVATMDLTQGLTQQMMDQFTSETEDIVAQHCQACTGAVQGLGPVLPTQTPLPVNMGPDMNLFLPELFNDNLDLMNPGFSENGLSNQDPNGLNSNVPNSFNVDDVTSFDADDITEVSVDDVTEISVDDVTNLDTQETSGPDDGAPSLDSEQSQTDTEEDEP